MQRVERGDNLCVMVADVLGKQRQPNGDQKYLPSAKILHKKTTGVKFDGAGVIFSKTTNGDKTSDDMRRNKNVGEAEVMGGKSGGTEAGDGEMLPIANKNTRWYML